VQRRGHPSMSRTNGFTRDAPTGTEPLFDSQGFVAVVSRASSPSPGAKYSRAPKKRENTIEIDNIVTFFNTTFVGACRNSIFS